MVEADAAVSEERCLPNNLRLSTLTVDVDQHSIGQKRPPSRSSRNKAVYVQYRYNGS
jgi:hypothetical protein